MRATADFSYPWGAVGRSLPSVLGSRPAGRGWHAGHNPSWGCRNDTQGRRGAPTLGFEAQSLWDCQEDGMHAWGTVRAKRLGLRRPYAAFGLTPSGEMAYQGRMYPSDFSL
jgi:hypothetical protein